jgi:adenine deaminase
MGSLHPATRYAMDGEIGGLGHSRRADLVLLDDSLQPQRTWYGGELVIDDRRPTAALEKVLRKPYRYPAAAFRTVTYAKKLRLVPEPPARPCTANVIRTALPGIILFHERIALEPAAAWDELRALPPAWATTRTT